MIALALVDEMDRAMPVATESKAALALRINELSTAELTTIVRRMVGPDYFASTCAGVYAIVRMMPGGIRESARGRSWAEALQHAKVKWQWDLGGMARRGPGFDPTDGG